MALKALSKQGLVIGVIVALCGIMYTILQILKVEQALRYDGEYEYYVPKNYLRNEVIVLIIALIVILLSISMILGIITKRSPLLILWLVAAFLIAGWRNFIVFQAALERTRLYWEQYTFCVIELGMQIVVIYPICLLYYQMRLERAAKR